MSVMKKSGELPPDAVVLTEDEALLHQTTLINEWDKYSEVWPLRHGVVILACAASSIGMYMNNHYRRKLKLRKVGKFSSYMPIVVLPGMMSALMHKMFVTHDILLEKTKCPVCLQVRAAAMQIAIGVIYPSILAPFGSFMYATRHATYRLPDITTDFLGAFRIIGKFTRPIGTQISLIFVGQGLLASWFAYMEAKSYYKVKETILQLEEEWENSKENLR